MSDLKPCPNPWCGSAEIIRVSAIDDDSGKVRGEFRQCIHCGITSPAAPTEAAADNAWNDRESGAGDIPFQDRVAAWMLECFTPAIASDKLERNDRFIEEALELVQSLGYSAERAHALVDYVFSRPVGDPFQEVGGVAVTLAALCTPHGLSHIQAAEAELARISVPEIIEKIRTKQANKPVGSALPVPINQAEQSSAQVEPVVFDKPVHGHWDSEEGAAAATACLGETRQQLTKGDLTDFYLANAQFLADRNDLDLVVWQTAAKERIRWLSAQLAAALQQSSEREAKLTAEIERLREKEFNRGTLIAASTLINVWGKSTEAEELLRSVNADKAMVKSMDFTDYDRIPLLAAIKDMEG